MITGNIGDWAAASEAAHAAGNGMQCNGYHSEEPYPVPDRRRSGRNDSATHTTQFETLDASALTLRLAEVDGAIAQYQAVSRPCALSQTFASNLVAYPRFLLPVHTVIAIQQATLYQ